MEMLAKIVGTLVVASCVTLVVSRAASAPAPRVLPVATAEQRAMFAATVVSQEEQWRYLAADDFPSDNWSQRDAFHGHEAVAVRDMAASSGVSYEEVIRAIDDDLHRGGGGDRNANAVPCKPRPVFD